MSRWRHVATHPRDKQYCITHHHHRYINRELFVLFVANQQFILHRRALGHCGFGVALIASRAPRPRTHIIYRWFLYVEQRHFSTADQTHYGALSNTFYLCSQHSERAVRTERRIKRWVYEFWREQKLIGHQPYINAAQSIQENTVDRLYRVAGVSWVCVIGNGWLLVEFLLFVSTERFRRIGLRAYRRVFATSAFTATCF